MNFLCALNDTVRFFRSCRKAWVLLAIFALIPFIKEFLPLSYQERLFIAESITGGFDLTARILTSIILLPIALIAVYLLCILTLITLDFGRNKDISLRRSAKIALKRYPYLLASTIVLVPIIFLPFYCLNYLNLNSKVFLVVILFAFSVYLSLRLSLFYCFVIDGAKLNSLKLSWIASKEAWKDIFLIGLIFFIIGSIPFLSGLSSAFMFTSLTFLYLQIKKEGCYET